MCNIGLTTSSQVSNIRNILTDFSLQHYLAQRQMNSICYIIQERGHHGVRGLPRCLSGQGPLRGSKGRGPGSSQGWPRWASDHQSSLMIIDETPSRGQKGISLVESVHPGNLQAMFTRAAALCVCVCMCVCVCE